MAGGREAAHINANLGDDDLCAQVADAWNATQQADCRTKGLEIVLHPLVDLSGGVIQHVDLAQMQAQLEKLSSKG